MGVVNGRLHAYHTWEPLPDAETDPLLAPHWASTDEPKQFGGIPTSEGWHYPGIIATGIGAGCRDATGRKRSQDLLTECGFTCLRSPRGADGKYWEQWVLHNMLAAAGPLDVHMKAWRAANIERTWHSEAEEACRFLT